ncbi:MAG: HAD family acid phosphatase, partial [Bacteroidota bacterium]|nr:HAD family acid phosphatase [Bacteroidota bacterium]
MKKLIIVTVVIMLASCATVKQTSTPSEGSPAPTAGNNSVLIAEGRAARPEPNLYATDLQEDQDHLILATLWYQKSAEMRALYYQCFRNAETALRENLALQGGRISAADSPVTMDTALAKDKRPAAVVLDIDETLLDNSPFQGWQVLEKKPFNNDDWLRWVELARARPLPGAVEFTRYADSLGVGVFYVSNRTVQEMGPTIENMKLYGLANADSTHLLLKQTTSSKVERRAQIEKNFDIILPVSYTHLRAHETALCIWYAVFCLKKWGGGGGGG